MINLLTLMYEYTTRLKEREKEKIMNMRNIMIRWIDIIMIDMKDMIIDYCQYTRKQLKIIKKTQDINHPIIRSYVNIINSIKWFEILIQNILSFFLKN